MREPEELGQLYRKPARDALTEQGYGRPIAKMPRSWLFFTLMLILMIFSAALFLLTSTYSRKETAAGWLSPKEGLVRVTVPQLSQVIEVRATQGDKIAEGEVIAILSQDRQLPTGTGTLTEILQQFNREREELALQQSLEAKGLKADVKFSQDMLNILVDEKEIIAKQIAQQSDRVDIQRDLYERVLKLYENDQTASFLELQSQNERYLTQEQALTGLEQRLRTIEREITNAKATIERRPFESQRTQSEISRRLIELDSKITNSISSGQQAIVSPVSGSIASLSISTGSTVLPQQVVGTILPSSSELLAEIFIPSRAVGFIEPEQTVRLMYSAFPHQTFGAANGQIASISTAILQPEEIPSAIGMKEPAYRAWVGLDSQTMEGFGQTLTLRPGMTLTAEIILEERTFLQWVLQPLQARRQQ